MSDFELYRESERYCAIKSTVLNVPFAIRIPAYYEDPSEEEIAHAQRVMAAEFRRFADELESEILTLPEKADGLPED